MHSLKLDDEPSSYRKDSRRNFIKYFGILISPDISRESKIEKLIDLLFIDRSIFILFVRLDFLSEKYANNIILWALDYAHIDKWQIEEWIDEDWEGAEEPAPLRIANMITGAVDAFSVNNRKALGGG